MKRWEKEGVKESHRLGHQFWNVPILLKMSKVLALWLLQVSAQLLANYLHFSFTLQDPFVPKLTSQKT